MNINAKHSSLLQAGEGYNKDCTFEKAKKHVWQRKTNGECTWADMQCAAYKQLNICTFPILQEHQHWGLTLCLWFFRNKKLLSKICHWVAFKLSYCHGYQLEEYLHCHLSAPSPTSGSIPKGTSISNTCSWAFGKQSVCPQGRRWDGDEKEMCLHINIFHDISRGVHPMVYGIRNRT